MRYIFLIIFFFTQTVYASEIFIVFKVNNEIITNVDIDNEYRYLLALNPNLKKVSKKKISNLAKDSIIREKIKEKELSQYFDLTKSNKFIKKIIKNFYKKLGMESEQEFKNYLSTYSLSFEQVKYKISIEAAWNDLIYQKFSNKMNIDEEKIKKKINEMIINKKKNQIFLLSEILFNSDKAENIDKKFKEIEKSISEIGFKSTVNLYSKSDTAKLGGEVGWVNENQLSELVKKKISSLKIGEYTNPIVIPGGLLILNLDDKKIQEENINFDKEFNKQINYEKNTQLNQFSKIYFNKIKKNSTINE